MVMVEIQHGIPTGPRKWDLKCGDNDDMNVEDHTGRQRPRMRGRVQTAYSLHHFTYRRGHSVLSIWVFGTDSHTR